MKPVAGVDIFIELYEKRKSYHYALVTNDAAFDATGEHSRKALLQKGFTIVKLFSPEHGMSAQGPDGAVQQNAIDIVSGLPVISLYGQKMKPSPEDLNDVDAVLFDIPDVGCRFYTYLWTMTYVLEACSECNKPIIILDRPNPTGGNMDQAEGPWLAEENCTSFVGRWNIPIRHCCTMGELALYFNHSRSLGAQLEVIACKNWNRESFFGYPDWFVPTSPAMRHVETALLYPGTGLWEGVNLHEGRGTPYPFKLVGAPWLDAGIAEAWQQLNIPGLTIRYRQFVPAAGRYAGMQCNGLLYSVVEEHLLRPVRAMIQLLHLVAKHYPENFSEASYPTAANKKGTGHLDKLVGVKDAFFHIKNENYLNTEIASEWKEIIQPFLLY